MRDAHGMTIDDAMRERGLDPKRIVEAGLRLLGSEPQKVRRPELWDGQAATRISALMLKM